MLFNGILDPEPVAMLRRILNTHCSQFGIISDDQRTSVALSLLALYQNGITGEAELARLIEPADRFSRHCPGSAPMAQN